MDNIEQALKEAVKLCSLQILQNSDCIVGKLNCRGVVDGSTGAEYDIYINGEEDNPALWAYLKSETKIPLQQ